MAGLRVRPDQETFGIVNKDSFKWIYYGLLIASRPVIAWNMIGVLITFLMVGAYLRFAHSETDRDTR